MTQPNHPLGEQEKADLVAFLDGELTGEAARALEARLSLDPAARAEADSLKRTWDLLDFLPRPEPSPSFTNRTMEKLAPIRAARRAAAGRLRWRPWLVGAGWAAAVLIAAAAGYGVATWTGAPPPDPGKDLARDLRVIEYKRYYDHVDDMKFLNDLDQPDLFGDDTTGS